MQDALKGIKVLEVAQWWFVPAGGAGGRDLDGLDYLAGLSLDEILLAWSFRTRSRVQVTGALLRLQEAAARWPLGAATILTDAVEGENRQLSGTIEV